MLCTEVHDQMSHRLIPERDIYIFKHLGMSIVHSVLALLVDIVF